MVRRFSLVFAVAASLLAAEAAVEQARKKISEKKFDEAYTALEEGRAKTKAPKDYASAYLAVGDGFMYNDALPPRMKYPTALRAYRDVLKYDKENKKARTGIDTIEGIYKSMGRPVPQ